MYIDVFIQNIKGYTYWIVLKKELGNKLHTRQSLKKMKAILFNDTSKYISRNITV